MTRSMYWMQLQPYLERFDRQPDRDHHPGGAPGRPRGHDARAFRFAGVDENFTSEQFDREWEKSTAKESDQYQLMEKLIKLPGFRSFDRNFDRLPESMRWMVEKVVHDPDKPSAPKPELPDQVRERLLSFFGEDVAAPPGVRGSRVRRLEELLVGLSR